MGKVGGCLSQHFRLVVVGAHRVADVLLVLRLQEAYLLVLRQMVEDFNVLVLLEAELGVLDAAHLLPYSFILRMQLLIEVEEVG